MNHHRGKILVSGKNLSLTLGRQPVLEGVSIEISKEDIVTVVGPNGAGKTTLLKILLGLLKPKPVCLSIGFSHTLLLDGIHTGQPTNGAVATP